MNARGNKNIFKSKFERKTFRVFLQAKLLAKNEPFLCVEDTSKWSTATSVKLQTKYIEFHSKAISFLISRLLTLFYADNHI
jgi:hypothetical protein